MGNQNNQNQFREDEIVIMSHWEKRKEEWVKSVYPMIGGLHPLLLPLFPMGHEEGGVGEVRLSHDRR